MLLVYCGFLFVVILLGLFGISFCIAGDYVCFALVGAWIVCGVVI